MNYSVLGGKAGLALLSLPAGNRACLGVAGILVVIGGGNERVEWPAREALRSMNIQRIETERDCVVLIRRGVVQRDLYDDETAG